MTDASPPTYQPFEVKTPVHKIGLSLIALTAIVPAFILAGWIPEAVGKVSLATWAVIAAVGGLVGGALFTSKKGPVYAGLLGGPLAALGALALVTALLRVSHTVWKIELVLAVALGMLPGGLVLWALLKRR